MSERTERLTLPVLPLREVVLFPGTTAPIGAGRPGTLRAIEAALATPERLIFAVSQRQNVEQVSPEGLYTIGTIARIGQMQRGLAGMQLLLHGERRGIAMHVGDKNGYLETIVLDAEELPPLNPDDAAFVGLYKEARARAAELGQKTGLPEEVVQQVLAGVHEPGQFADLVAGYLDISPTDRQALLETLSVEERLRRVLVHVQRQISVLDAQEDIKSQVQEELGERQREMFLREQLKQIRRELGEDESGGELEELQDKLDALELTPEARKEVDREFGRLERIGRESMEAQVIRTFLDTVAELPWNTRSEESLDLGTAQTILDQDHYALGDVKDRVLEFLAVRQLKETARRVGEPTATPPVTVEDGQGASAPEGGIQAAESASRPVAELPVGNIDEKAAKGPILLFVGPPGVGKTSVAKSIARAMGRKYVRISLGGARDEADIRGHRRTYVGAMPGRITAGHEAGGHPEPGLPPRRGGQAGRVLPGRSRERAARGARPGPERQLRRSLPRRAVRPQRGAVHLHRQLPPEHPGTAARPDGGRRVYRLHRAREADDRPELPCPAAAQGEWTRAVADRAARTRRSREVITGYTREAGVRQLEREIGKLCRKVARKIAAKESSAVTITRTMVAELLGRPKVHPERAAREDHIGVRPGMYYTPIGGDIMFVEASIMRGKGELVLTGQLGDVMKESARAALTYARSHAAGLGIKEEIVRASATCTFTCRRAPSPRMVPLRGSRWRPRWSRCCPAARCATTSR